MNVDAYLGRIGYQGPREPTLQTLEALHFAHLVTVPFENLDIGLGRPIRLDLRSLFEKIVLRRRGGFCYELNGLFASLLEELGYPVSLHSARDVHADGTLGPDFDHLVLEVGLPDGARYLADVGWGDSFVCPLRLGVEGEQSDGHHAYRIQPHVEGGLLIQQQPDGLWEEQYVFSLEPRSLEECEVTCLYHQTSPLSSFTHGRICTLARSGGRVTLSKNRLILTENGHREERSVPEDEVREVLKLYFGIEF